LKEHIKMYELLVSYPWFIGSTLIHSFVVALTCVQMTHLIMSEYEIKLVECEDKQQHLNNDQAVSSVTGRPTCDVMCSKGDVQTTVQHYP
jgi:hypothetical protein